MRDEAKLYDDIKFGEFNYGDGRAKHEPGLVEFIKQAAKRWGTVYDVGCGAGYWSRKCVELGVDRANIKCTDLSDANVGRLAGEGFDAVVDDLLETRLKPRTADFVICNGVIHHTPNPELAFKNLVKTTKKGGLIYLNVYNAWNPYFYSVHRASFPLRWAYWDGCEWPAKLAFALSAFAYQPTALIVFGKFLDEKTAWTIFADQVLTPHAHLFTKARINKLVMENGCRVREFRYNKLYLMISAVIEVI